MAPIHFSEKRITAIYIAPLFHLLREREEMEIFYLIVPMKGSRCK
jgi:hypothetical protein